MLEIVNGSSRLIPRLSAKNKSFPLQRTTQGAQGNIIYQWKEHRDLAVMIYIDGKSNNKPKN